MSGIFYEILLNWFGPTHKNVKAPFPIKPDIFRMISCYWMFLITQEWITFFSFSSKLPLQHNKAIRYTKLTISIYGYRYMQLQSYQLFTNNRMLFLRSRVVFIFYVQTLVFITKCCCILVKVIEIWRKLPHSDPSTLWPNKSTRAQLISLVIDICFWNFISISPLTLGVETRCDHFIIYRCYKMIENPIFMFWTLFSDEWPVHLNQVESITCKLFISFLFSVLVYSAQMTI